MHLVLVTEADGVLGLVDNRLASATVDVLVLGAAELVAGLLGGGLGVVGLEAAEEGVRWGAEEG